MKYHFDSLFYDGEAFDIRDLPVLEIRDGEDRKAKKYAVFESIANAIGLEDDCIFINRFCLTENDLLVTGVDHRGKSFKASWLAERRIPFYEPGAAESITETARNMIRNSQSELN